MALSPFDQARARVLSQFAELYELGAIEDFDNLTRIIRNILDAKPEELERLRGLESENAAKITALQAQKETL